MKRDPSNTANDTQGRNFKKVVVRSVKEFDKYIDHKSNTQATPIQRSKEYTIATKPMANPYQDAGGIDLPVASKDHSAKNQTGAFSSKSSLRPMKTSFVDLEYKSGANQRTHS